MNYSIANMIAGVMPAVRRSGLLSSLCTIVVPPPTDENNAAGAIDPAIAWTPLAGHINIPCTAPPVQTSDSTSSSEIYAQEQLESVSMLHVLLDDYYPLILGSYRAQIAGVEYDIANVEHDSQKQMTRLVLKKGTI